MNTSGLIAGLAFAAFAAMPLAVHAETVSGKIVDLATYVTRDHNMDAMHASMPGKSSAMMHEGAMMPHACPPALGLVTNNGVGLYLLVTQMGTKTAKALSPEARVLNAQGKPLGFTLAQWFGARGRAVLSPLPGGGTMMVYSMTGLVPGGVYSFFENHFSSDGVTFTPLDGSADHNTFTATSSGAANGSISIPAAVTHSEGILLVYHSDAVAHGADRGQIGVNAHHQLIIRLQ
jgi:hypothetical protein